MKAVRLRGVEGKHSRQREEHESSLAGIKQNIVPAIPRRIPRILSPRDFPS